MPTPPRRWSLAFWGPYHNRRRCAGCNTAHRLVQRLMTPARRCSQPAWGWGMRRTGCAPALPAARATVPETTTLALAGARVGEAGACVVTVSRPLCGVGDPSPPRPAGGGYDWCRLVMGVPPPNVLRRRAMAGDARAPGVTRCSRCTRGDVPDASRGKSAKSDGAYSDTSSRRRVETQA